MLKMLGYNITEKEYSILLNDLWTKKPYTQLTTERLKQLIPRLKSSLELGLK